MASDEPEHMSLEQVPSVGASGSYFLVGLELGVQTRLWVTWRFKGSYKWVIHPWLEHALVNSSVCTLVPHIYVYSSFVAKTLFVL